MSALSQRSSEKELIDLGSDYYTAEEYQHCLKMLFRVSRLFGFFSSTRTLLKKFSNTASLLDVGCGGGLFLLHLSRYFPAMPLTGIDISTEAIRQAEQALQVWREKKAADNVSFRLLHKPELDIPESSVDIILATLMCHHLSDEELVIFLQQTERCAREAVILNDLHRHRLPYVIYRWLSPILFRNRLITHDGLISIRRGFTRKEWQVLLNKAGIKHYQIQWCFPFRWRVILWKKS
jgi:SAM-dependent methyltransferase